VPGQKSLLGWVASAMTRTPATLAGVPLARDYQRAPELMHQLLRAALVAVTTSTSSRSPGNREP